MIDEILLASRLDANPNEQLQNAEFPLHELFEEETKRLNIQANTQIVSLYGDQRLLRRVIRNLLENALRYGKDPEAQLRVLANENSCEITIVDQGPVFLKTNATKSSSLSIEYEVAENAMAALDSDSPSSSKSWNYTVVRYTVNRDEMVEVVCDSTTT